MIRESNKNGQALILEHEKHWSNNWQARNQFISKIEIEFILFIYEYDFSFYSLPKYEIINWLSLSVIHILIPS